ncbi:MAG: hypothetical protein ABI609_12505 [Acidobacteriota bacterium]
MAPLRSSGSDKDPSSPVGLPHGTGSRIERVSPDRPPLWVSDLVDIQQNRVDDLTAAEGGTVRLLSGRVAEARAMPAAELRRATGDLYAKLRRAIAAGSAPYPVRFWNMLPFIQEPLGDGLDRYMAFNLGRHDAFRDWAGGADRLASVVPTATGIGHHGADLFVYALCAGQPAAPVENHRQRPAWRYSERWGPAPPCFARAGRLDLGGGLIALMVGGTASVRGEESIAPHLLEEQLAETFLNLDAVIATGLGVAEDRGGQFLVEARAYCLHADDASAIATAITSRCPDLERLEICHADICRAELRVEIEGLAVARRVGDRLEPVRDAIGALCSAFHQ